VHRQNHDGTEQNEEDVGGRLEIFHTGAPCALIGGMKQVVCLILNSHKINGLDLSRGGSSQEYAL
jgi:hypothetical protein